MSVNVTVSDARFSLLEPVIQPARTDVIWSTDDPDVLAEYLGDFLSGDLLAIDFETNSTDTTHPDFKTVTIGLSSSIGTLSVDTRDWPLELFVEVLEYLAEFPLIAHNITFDGGVFVRHGIEANWQYCTYGLLKQLASEGFPGQQWGLKWAQENLLGWPETNERELNEWLVAEGYVNKLDRLRALNTPELRLAEYEARNKAGGRKLLPDKSQMWRAPHDILGWYCALDADSTYLLMKHVLEPALRRVPPQARAFHQGPFIESIRIALEWGNSGIPINEEEVKEIIKDLRNQQILLDQQLRSHPDIVDHIKQWQHDKAESLLSDEPEKYKKRKQRKEPEKYTKSGEVSKNWLKYQELESAPPEISKTWLNWVERRDRLHTETTFNFGSGDQLRWLLYESSGLLQYQITQPHIDKNSPGKIRLDGTDFDIKMTDSGQLPIDKTVLKFAGEVGKLLIDINKIDKLVGTYYEPVLSKLREGRLYPKIRIPGTLTGRWAGSDGLNFQNLPNDERFLGLFRADDGYTMIQADFGALEPHALAELSGDKTYMKLYGPNAKPNDVYLFIGAHVKGYREKLLEVGYDVDNPTPEGVAAAKKAFAKERAIWKVLQLSCLPAHTLVLTNRGWVRIVEVTEQDLVWNGYEWSTTSGCIYRGEREVIHRNGITATPDHQVKTTKGWEVHERSDSTQLVRSQQVSATWSDVWRLVSYQLKRKTRKWLSIHRG